MKIIKIEPFNILEKSFKIFWQHLGDFFKISFISLLAAYFVMFIAFSLWPNAFIIKTNYNGSVVVDFLLIMLSYILPHLIAVPAITVITVIIIEFIVFDRSKPILGEDRFLKSFHWDQRHTQIAIIIALQLIVEVLLEHLSFGLVILNLALDFPKFLRGFFEVVAQSPRIVRGLGEVLSVLFTLYSMYLIVVIVREGDFKKSDFSQFIHKNKVRLLILTVICIYGFDAISWVWNFVFNFTRNSLFIDAGSTLTYIGFLLYYLIGWPLLFGYTCVVSIAYALSYRILVRSKEKNFENS